LDHLPGTGTGDAPGCGVRYRAFISYSHADARWAAWLHRNLEGYQLPSRLRGSSGEHGPLPDRLSPIFRDREDLSSAGHLGPQIQAALADSEALVVVCSPGAARSPWVDSEIRAFKRLGRGDRIYALIVDGEPNAGDARECFPEALRFDLSADGESLAGEANPVAADARAGKDGKALALLKLLAGLFGLPLDTLRQREAQRRHRRMAAITALAVLVMLVTSVLAVQAVMAQRAAERRQKQAEALVDFMLGDLNDKLSEVGRLDILSAVNDKAMTYFQSLPKTDVTQEALEQRAKALVKIGVVRSEQGELPKAMESFKAASDVSAALARTAPTDVARQLAYAEVQAYIGLTHWYQGDLDAARRGFEAAHRILTAARRYAPQDRQLLFQLSTVDNNIGHVLEANGRIDAATEHYQRMREVAGQLARLGPDNADWQTQLGMAHNNLAKMALLRGDLRGAISGYRDDMAIRTRLVNHAPGDNGQRRLLLIAHATLGRTLALAGEMQEGQPLLRKALNEARRLNAMEPDSTTYRGDVGLYALQLARVERQRGDLDAAHQLIRESLVMMDALVGTNPGQPGWQRQRAEAWTEQAEQAIAVGRRDDEVTALLRRALVVLEAQLADGPQERSTVLATVNARLRLASVSADPSRADLLGRSLATIDAQESAHRDPRLRALHEDALRQSGRYQEATAIAKALRASGYHAPGPGAPNAGAQNSMIH
jgi:tetratricopeptide (TPR) repeat protein